MKRFSKIFISVVLVFSIFLTSCSVMRRKSVTETSVELVNEIIQEKWDIDNVLCTKVKLGKEHKDKDGKYYYTGTAKLNTGEKLDLLITYESDSNLVEVEVLVE